MFEKDLKIAYLMDFYGDALPEHTRAVLKKYYEDDLSLSEIAESEGISRQGIRHIIKRGEDELSFFESALGLASHYSNLREAAKRLIGVADSLGSRQDEQLSKLAATVRECAEIMLSKN